MSNAPSDPKPRLDLERDLPTTAQDVEVLRRLREQLPAGDQGAATATSVDTHRILAMRPTSEGWDELSL
jgi:hypothetical protein